jgi:hypothetical protein
MMPSDSYRLYQVERVMSAAEARRADEQAAMLAAAIARLVHGLTRPARLLRLTRPARPAPKPRPGTARIMESR